MMCSLASPCLSSGLLQFGLRAEIGAKVLINVSSVIVVVDTRVPGLSSLKFQHSL